MATEKTKRWWPALIHGTIYTIPYIAVTRSILALAVDDDDPELDRYLEAYLEMCERFSWLELRDGPRRRLCGTLNQLAAEHAPSWRNVGFMGDDHRPSTPSWDARFVECLSGGGP